MNIQDRFLIGMKRKIPQMLPDHGVQIELGPGNSPLVGVDFPLEYPKWDANKDPIPFESGTIDVIHMYHFLEHVNDPVMVLKECERVLEKGGHINIVVPYWKSELAIEDLDHKNLFCEGTWDNIFYNSGYDKGIDWNLSVHFNIIIGVVERNLCLMTQLVKL